MRESSVFADKLTFSPHNNNFTFYRKEQSLFVVNFFTKTSLKVSKSE